MLIQHLWFSVFTMSFVDDDANTVRSDETCAIRAFSVQWPFWGLLL